VIVIGTGTSSDTMLILSSIVIEDRERGKLTRRLAFTECETVHGEFFLLNLGG
jgi:hypothetical protein